jgi:16S rRNA (cytidine1402-2'-O)-methyltransferase
MPTPPSDSNSPHEPLPSVTPPSDSTMAATVFLIPCWLEEQALAPIPAYLVDAVKQCTVFFVENERSARRFVKALWKEMVIDNYEWVAIHKMEDQALARFRARLREGRIIGILSEAGCPGVADPGQLLTAAAHEAGATVRPLVGPSSILLALMASGLNGQQFRFAGYLPVDHTGRVRGLRELEAESRRLHCTQLFIETPYRNQQLFDAILQTCNHATRLCVAADLTGPEEFVRTLNIAQWKEDDRPSLNKRPAIFLLLAGG